MNVNPKGLIVVVAFALSACAVGPDYVRPDAGAPPQWHAPLPHGGDPARQVDWWRQFDDPLLAELIARAENDSPTLDAALARIRQSRAAVDAARGALFPGFAFNAERTRSGDAPVVPEQTIARGVFQTAWEIDLFGRVRRGVEASTASLAGVQAAWHDARIALAAEVALEYVGLRTCEARLADTEADLASRRVTERLTREKAQAGFASPADAALAEASAADGAGRALVQQMECDLGVKSLAMLSGESEPTLRVRLASRRGLVPHPASLAVDTVPADVLRSRPDVAVAERALAAASADIGVAKAQLFPKLSLFGWVGRQRQTVDGVADAGRVWSFGPTLDVPLFDGGRRLAGVEAARGRYDEALAVYKDRVRRAVREVEQALVRTDVAAGRVEEAQRAAARYDAAFAAAEVRWQAGLASQLELEEVRRLAVAARSQHIGVVYESVVAWVALYRAVGGGWLPDDATEREGR